MPHSSPSTAVCCPPTFSSDRVVVDFDRIRSLPGLALSNNKRKEYPSAMFHPNRTKWSIAVKAEIDRHPALLKAAANESGVARLHCRAEGAREVSFSWRRNNVELRGPKYEVFQRRLQGSYVRWESELVISDVRMSDYGNYTCVAQSDLGSDHAQILLTTIGECS